MDGQGSHPRGLSRRGSLLGMVAPLAGVFLMHGPTPEHDLGATADHGSAMAMAASAPMAVTALLGSSAADDLRPVHPGAPDQLPTGHSDHVNGTCLAFLLSAATTVVVMTALS